MLRAAGGRSQEGTSNESTTPSFRTEAVQLNQHWTFFSVASLWCRQAFVTFKDAFKKGELNDDAQEMNLQAIRKAIKALNALDAESLIWPVQAADPDNPVATEAR